MTTFLLRQLSLVSILFSLLVSLSTAEQQSLEIDSAAREQSTLPVFVPTYQVVPRKQQLQFYPCMTCHHDLPVNEKPRPLFAPHLQRLNHGSGKFWCVTCHNAANYNVLQTSSYEQIDFDDVHQVCADCHATHIQDWAHGGHGKRASGWQQPRVIFSCTQCHDPHDPASKPRVPQAPPPVRAGLQRPLQTTEPVEKVWERFEK